MRRSGLQLLLSLCLVLASVGPLGAQSSGDVVVLAHSDVPVQTLSLVELRHLVLGDRGIWPSGVRVTLIINAPGAHERAVILNKVCQMTDAQFQQHWIAKVFRADTVTKPRIVESTAAAADLVARTPGAIAFVDASNGGKDVKVVKVNGLSPGESAYPLR